jgi:hypothetical protein
MSLQGIEPWSRPWEGRRLNHYPIVTFTAGDAEVPRIGSTYKIIGKVQKGKVQKGKVQKGKVQKGKVQKGKVQFIF